ncbi:L-threonylcarbamoyladenylate synthase [Marinobacterium arenosum]|uniref:L-threonylcarbamoyladenylate synthase n=1 Tax=Marinobacterium arenosum TaxID=2862496 RepID=UPI001C969EDE|nr:L-threonylcarbamoyladenylate synthase [Marinobacterium arenosum]MBY4677734.1 threonylcarbamoyl-AMP synthase [Marinobacterium arenosum]
MNGWHTRRAVETLRQGGVIAYPTEAVWGLGCDPFNEHAVARILKMKRRPVEKGLILVAGALSQIQFLLDPLTEQQRATLRASWPGPVTFLIPDLLDQVPHWVKGEHDSVAVRVSQHPLIRDVSKHFDGPIVSTSANPAGKEPARDRLKVNLYFRSEVDTIVPGDLGDQAQPSQIRDLRSGRILRS